MRQVVGRDGTAAARLAAFGVISIVAIAWFGTLPRGIVMGDDLRVVWDEQHMGFARSMLTALTDASFSKYRPVLMMLLSSQAAIFGHTFVAYEVVNFIVRLAATGVIALVAWHLSGRSLLTAVGIGLAFVASRLSYYEILQMLGLMEGLAILFTGLIVYDVVRALRERRERLLWRALLWFGILLYTDERFVTVAAFVGLAFIAYRLLCGPSRWISGAAATVFVVVSNVVLKSTVLHATFLQGTGGQAITFDAARMAGFLGSGIATIFGFNSGPSYLSGMDAAEGGFAAYLLGAAFAVSVVAALSIGIIAGVFRNTRPALVAVLLTLTLFIPLLLSACVSFRQEFRWLDAPYVVLLLAAAAGIGCLPRAWLRTIFGCAIGVTAVVLGLYYRHSLPNVYFMYSMAIASEVRDDVAQHHDAPLVLVTHGDGTLEGWVFMGHEFFDEFGFSSTPVRFVKELSDVADQSGVNLVDIKGNAATILALAGARPAEAVPSPVRPPQAKVVFDFYRDFGRGSINSATPADTPTKRGAFTAQWPSTGGPVASFVVLAGYRYAFDIDVKRKQSLRVYLTRLHAVGSVTRAVINVTDRGRTDTIAVSDIYPQTTTVPDWKLKTVDLDKFAGRRVRVEFGADSPTGDQTAAWIAFGDPAIVKR